MYLYGLFTSGIRCYLHMHVCFQLTDRPLGMNMGFETIWLARACKLEVVSDGWIMAACVCTPHP